MDWTSINDALPKKGRKVRCKLSQFIGFNINEVILYRMKHNGKWNDYDKLVTHWKPLIDEQTEKMIGEAILPNKHYS